MDARQNLDLWEGYVDWRNRPAVRGKHGGKLAAFFVLAVEVMENLTYLATASNLVLYLSTFMHFSPSSSAIIVTNFMGTAFLLALLGGFLCDAFFTTYSIYLISAAIEFLGLIILTVQAQIPSLKPSICASFDRNTSCQQVHRGNKAMLFLGLYLVALGVGGIKSSLPPHGAEQFDDSTSKGRKQRSAFFNYFVFCLACGALIAVTFMVWIEDNRGWLWGFGISAGTILLTIPIFLSGSFSYRIKIPTGSPITTIFKVLAGAISHSRSSRNRNAVTSMSTTPSQTADISSDEEKTADALERQPSQDLKFLNGAAIDNPVHPQLECSIKEVEEVKAVLKTLPIFASTIMLNCCLAQLSTFSVQQAATMNTRIGSFKVPPASLPTFPVIFIMTLAPIYDQVILPFARKLTKTELGITHLQRIGTGLFLSIIAMAVAAVVETKRKGIAKDSGLTDSVEPLPVTFLWVALQYLFLGSADLFSLAGLMEFFFTEAPTSMKSVATALSWTSLAMGYYFSGILVSVLNQITRGFSRSPWLYGRNLNYYHLERFYWLMCVLSGLNFLHFLFWARRYEYRSSSVTAAKQEDEAPLEVKNSAGDKYPDHELGLP